MAIFAQQALVAGGLGARCPPCRSTDGRIAAVETGRAAAPGDERHAIGVPGLPNLHSHAFQRGMAGLAETRGPADDSFWTWRELMYRFARPMTPDEVEAIAAQPYVEMLEAGFTRVGEFHYLHHDLRRRALCRPRRDGRRGSPPRPQRDRHRPDAAAGLLRPCRLRRRGARRRPAPLRQRSATASPACSRQPRGSARALPDAVVGVAPHSLRAVTPDELGAVAAAGAGRRRSTSTSPSRCRRSRTASPGRARGRSSGCSTKRRSTSAGA